LIGIALNFNTAAADEIIPSLNKHKIVNQFKLFIKNKFALSSIDFFETIQKRTNNQKTSTKIKSNNICTLQLNSIEGERENFI
jgi:type III secretory pathway component EscR